MGTQPLSPSPHAVPGAAVVVLATGGTIAGASPQAADNVGYTAAQRGVAELVAAVPGLDAAGPLVLEQVAQLDSKDMGPAVWVPLLQRLAAHLARPEVAGVVVTHGTDTLEETAWLLQRLLAPAKPVVLTAAMRPATALGADGPANLRDAVALARWPGARGVLVAMGGQVHAGEALRKRHPYRVDAMSSGDAGPLGMLEEGRLRRWRPWPGDEGMAAGDGTACPAGLPVPSLEALPADPNAWPWVEVVASHAGASGRGVVALRAAGVQGLVVAATGNGSVHQALAVALDQAQAEGLPVWRCTRCLDGRLVEPPAALDASASGWRGPSPVGALTPWQARLAMQLALMAR